MMSWQKSCVNIRDNLKMLVADANMLAKAGIKVN